MIASQTFAAMAAAAAAVTAAIYTALGPDLGPTRVLSVDLPPGRYSYEIVATPEGGGAAIKTKAHVEVTQ